MVIVSYSNSFQFYLNYKLTENVCLAMMVDLRKHLSLVILFVDPNFSQKDFTFISVYVVRQCDTAVGFPNSKKPLDC